jgi:hypothetical protein
MIARRRASSACGSSMSAAASALAVSMSASVLRAGAKKCQASAPQARNTSIVPMIAK